MDDCIPMEALGTLDASDESQRRHLERCARCSAMVVAYREFMRAEAPKAARVREAETRLAAFVQERVEGKASVGAAPRRARGRFFEMPNLRFAAAAAVTLLAVVAVWRWVAGPDEIAVRGGDHTVLTLEAPRVSADGAIELRWSSVPESDSYRVILLRDDLSEVVRLDPTTELSITLDRSALPAGATRWQVAAYQEGAVAAESVPQYLPE